MNTTLPWSRNGTTSFINDAGVRVCTGAQMGRRDIRPPVFFPRKLHLRKVPINPQGYDSGGAYWGSGTPLYCVWDLDPLWPVEVFFRARGRDDAKEQARAAFPNATFYR